MKVKIRKGDTVEVISGRLEDKGKRGQVIKATIVLTKAYTASDDLAKELQEHVKRVTAPYKYPRVIEFVPELPKTISGKIRRVEIRAGDTEKTFEAVTG